MPFGFRHHIAHGMWTKARCLAELRNRLPEALRVAVAFKKPISLPGQVRSAPAARRWHVDFGLSTAPDVGHHRTCSVGSATV